MLGMATNTKYSYPQKYFLIPEACRHFGLKERTLKSWRETGIDVPGLLKVKGSNYYVIEPIEFHTWLIETKLEPATTTENLFQKEVNLGMMFLVVLFPRHQNLNLNLIFLD